MYYFASQVLLSFCLFSTALAILSQQPTTSQNSISLPTLPSLRTGTFCNAPSRGSGIEITDCFKALRRLPDTDSSGIFHSGGPSDVFQLPISSATGACRVLFEMRSSLTRERSSWVVARTAASELLWACLSRGSVRIKSEGGNTYIGDTNGIMIRIGRADVTDTASD